MRQARGVSGKGGLFLGTDSLQDLLGVDFGANLSGREDALHTSLFVDEERGAQEADGDATVAVFLAPHPHGFDELLVGVGDQWERQRL